MSKEEGTIEHLQIIRQTQAPIHGTFQEQVGLQKTHCELEHVKLMPPNKWDVINRYSLRQLQTFASWLGELGISKPIVYSFDAIAPKMLNQRFEQAEEMLHQRDEE